MSAAEEQTKRRIKGKDLKKIFRVFSYVRPHLFLFIVGLVFLSLSSVALMLFPKVLEAMLGVVAPGSTTASSGTGFSATFFSLKINSTVEGLILAMIIIFTMAVTSFFRVAAMNTVSERALASLRLDLYGRLLHLPLAFYDKRRVGEMMSRITADVQQLQSLMSVTIAEFLRQVIVILAGIGLLLYTSAELTLFMLAVFPVLVVIAVVFGRFIRKVSKKTQDELAESNVIVDETLQSIQVVKSFTNETFERKRYESSIMRVVKKAIKTAQLRGGFIAFAMFTMLSGISLVIWYGTQLILQKELTSPELTSFIIYTVIIAMSGAGLSDLFSQLQKALGSSERLFEIMEEPEEPGLSNQNASSLKGDIVYQDIRFRYPTREDVEVLKGVSLTVSEGEKVALAGASGAGKSTIVQLLLRLYEVGHGELSINGTNIREVNLTHLRENIGIVPQEVILFGGSIRENIAYGKPGASDDEIRDAAAKANALEFINSFPEGLDTLVGERGVKLSGGQRQRIAIARAILKDPAILILDEATSSLDAASEKLVQDALNTLMEDRTTIIIAHRLATIRNVDRIYVLDEGQIVESGSHQELVGIDEGYYNKLVQLQLQGA